MKGKKVLSGLLAGAMLVGAVSMPVTASAAEEEITITMVESLTSPERTELLRSMADKYEELNPNTKINIISPAQESADSKIAQMLSGGDAVDIIEIRDHTLRTYVTNGWLVNLQDYIDAWDEKDTLSGAANAAMVICDDEPYYMPFGFYERAVFIRQDIFEEAGIEYPTTWRELIDAATQLTDSASSKYGFSFRGVSGCYENMNLMIYAAVGHDKIISDNAGYFIDDEGTTIFTLPEAKAAVEDFKELFQNASPADSIAWGFSEQVQGFISGTAAILLQDSDAVPTMVSDLEDDQWDVIPLPAGDAGDVCLPNGYGGWGLTTNSEHPDEAADFIMFLSSAENNTEFAAQNGTLPIHTTAFESSDYFQGDEYQTYLKYAEDDTYHFVYPCMDYEAYATYKSEVDTVLQKYLSDEISADDLLGWLDEFWTEAFEAEGKIW
ncbi:sugar ABC transporter substrate-binding protein [Ruminococcus sp. 5_1_39BFAA]|uniref:ABC transporter substrate-binding protein n=1 Tax=Ruminococcus sp. 5_1_39BFAA TaxID=457412 RepID=UPI003567A150